MASNALMQEQRVQPPVAVTRAQLAIDHARPSRPRMATETQHPSFEVDLGLRAGVRLNFQPDHRMAIPEGLEVLVDTFRAMETLEANWDSYGGHPLNDGAVLPAVQLAVEGVKRCQAPSVVLRTNGGVGLRWSSERRDLEIDVDPDGRSTAFFEDRVSGEEFEIEEPAEMSDVMPLLHKFCRVD